MFKEVDGDEAGAYTSSRQSTLSWFGMLCCGLRERNRKGESLGRNGRGRKESRGRERWKQKWRESEKRVMRGCELG